MRKLPKKRQLKPVTFIPVTKAFKPQIEVQALADISGWADKQKRIKWTISNGSIGYLDETTAREFSIKGYVKIISGEVAPASEDEKAEIRSTMSVIGIGK